jgi:protein-disulfide isomerase
MHLLGRIDKTVIKKSICLVIARWSPRKIRIQIFLWLVLIATSYSDLGFAQTSKDLQSLRKELKTLQEGQRTIQKELETIKEILRARQAPAAPAIRNVVLSVDGAAFKGDKDAKLTLIEFSDYQCPFCAGHFRESLPQIERDYIKTGKLKYVVRDFPIASIHKNAFKAAEAARCAGEHGKYWEMHEQLFSNQNALDRNDLLVHAQTVGLELSAFQQCLDSGKYQSKVRRDIADGSKAGVQGTPAFFLGLTQPGTQEVKVLRKIEGAQPYNNFQEAIEILLSSQKK